MNTTLEQPESKLTSNLEIEYPSSDGQPMAENTEHYQWIVTIVGGLESLFRGDRDVFVAGDLLWYPVEGKPAICRAPDAMVVFGRPKRPRGAYIQHLEDHIAPQVVFEVLSKGNTILQMATKFDFYQTYGVEEYYVYDHINNDLAGWTRNGNHLEVIADMQNWQSPRLAIKFDISGDRLVIYNPDGSRFLTYLELAEQAQMARDRAEAERIAKEEALANLAKLTEKLRSLGIDPNQLT